MIALLMCAFLFATEKKPLVSVEVRDQSLLKIVGSRLYYPDYVIELANQVKEIGFGECPLCYRCFSTKHAFQCHWQEHAGVTVHCAYCSNSFKNKTQFNGHKKECARITAATQLLALSQIENN